MNAQEIQPSIGDWFNAGGIDHQISKNELKLWLDGLVELKPILLSEEWLLKAGFTRRSNTRWDIYSCDLLRFELCINKQDGEVSFEGDYCVNYNFPCQYVHQLQNLIFALTGSELTFTI